MDRVATVFKIFVISACLVQVNGLAHCAFDTDTFEGIEVITRAEDEYKIFPSILGTYNALGRVDSIGPVKMDAHSAKYLSFQFKAFGQGQLVVSLKKSLEDSLDAGIDTLEAIVPIICSNGGLSRWTFDFRLKIKDINNKLPVFNQDKYNFNVEIPWPLSVPINYNTEIIVTDDDMEWINAETRFSVNIDRILVTWTRLPVSLGLPKYAYSLQLFLMDSIIDRDTIYLNIRASGGLELVHAPVTINITRPNYVCPL